MKTFLREAHRIDYTPAEAVSSGDVIALAGFHGIAVADIAASARGCIEVDRIHKLKAASGLVWAQGDLLFWDATNGLQNFPTTGAQPIGVAAAAKVSADTTADVMLNALPAMYLDRTRRGEIRFFDDFFCLDQTATVGDWTFAGDATGTQLATDGKGGELSILTHSDDEDESYLSSYNEPFIFNTTDRVSFACRCRLTEANTDEANIIIGLSDTVGADSMVDAGAGPMASFDGAVFYKVDGTMTWGFCTSNAAAQTKTANVVTFTSASQYVVGFEYDPADGVTATITPWIYNETTGVMTIGTAHELTIAGLQEMHVLLGAKAGGTNAETLVVDYVDVAQER